MKSKKTKASANGMRWFFSQGYSYNKATGNFENFYAVDLEQRYVDPNGRNQYKVVTPNRFSTFAEAEAFFNQVRCASATAAVFVKEGR